MFDLENRLSKRLCRRLAVLPTPLANGIWTSTFGISQAKLIRRYYIGRTGMFRFSKISNATIGDGKPPAPQFRERVAPGMIAPIITHVLLDFQCRTDMFCVRKIIKYLLIFL